MAFVPFKSPVNPVLKATFTLDPVAGEWALKVFSIPLKLLIAKESLPPKPDLL